MTHLTRILSLAVGTALTGMLSAQVTATNTTTGAGCGGAFASFYENFAASAAFDLNNTTLTMIPSAGGYFVFGGTTAYVAPSATATVLTLGDDTEATVTLSAPFAYPGGTTSALTVCSNGYVSVATGNGNAWTPVVATFLAGTQAGWWNWHDYNPSIANGGRVKFEQIGAVAYITWDGVWNFSGTTAANANTFQFQFDTATGMVHLVFQTMSTLGNGRLVGYSPGGANLDPGSMDLSVALQTNFQTRPVDIAPLTVAASTRPLTGTAWSLNVTGVPATATIGVDILGFSDPAINDLAFLGLPGCGIRSSLDLLSPWPPTGASHSYALAIPANPTLLNFHLFTTSAAFVPGANAFGAITANGIDGKLGDI